LKCHPSDSSQSLALKKPLAGLGQKPFDVALYVLQAMPVCRAFAADQGFARRMLKNIMLCLSMQNKAMLFNKRKQFSSIVLEGH
jgi:hypothetical protein